MQRFPVWNAWTSSLFLISRTFLVWFLDTPDRRKHFKPLLTLSALSSMPQQVKQIIADRYIDQGRLQDLLARNFAFGSYSITVSSTDCLEHLPSPKDLVENQQVDHHCPSGIDRGNI